MRRITILEKIYRNNREAKRSLEEMLGNLIEVDAKVTSVSRGPRGWAVVSLEGSEEEVAAKYIESIHGTLSTLAELGEGDIRRGKIVDLGRVGYGIYVDIGVVDPRGEPVDALVPTFSLKKHLGIKGAMSIRRMSNLLGLMDNFPLDVRIFKVDRERLRVEARLTNAQARRLKHGRHRFYVCGETRRKIKNAIQRTGNSSHVVRVKRLGLLENEVQCSKDIDPHDILRDIGPIINAQMSVPQGL